MIEYDNRAYSIMLNVSHPQLSTSLPSSGFVTTPSSSSKARVPSPRPRNKQNHSTTGPPPAKSPTNSPRLSRHVVKPVTPPKSATNENEQTTSSGYKTLEGINEQPMSYGQHSRKNSKEKEEEEKAPISLGELVLKYSTLLPLQIQVKKGYHGSDERRCIAAEDVYNIHFVKHTKVVVLKDRRGVKFNIPLNSAVHFAPVFNPNNDIKEAMKGYTFERVSDLMALKTVPKIVQATKPHIRVDSKSTIEKSEVFILQSIVPIGVRKKVLQVYSITCNQNKLLQADSVGGFTTNPHHTYLYLLEIIEHFLNALPLDVQVVMDDGDNISRELPIYLTREVATLTHIDSETSLIASTSWGDNEVVLEEDQLPLDIPIDLPIEVVVQAADDLKELHLSDYTKKLFEKFDPCRIRVLRSRNIRRGFEKEGMKLERPERIYDIPINVCLAGNSHKSKSTSPQMRPRLATPAASQEAAYSQAYQSLAAQTKMNPKPQYATPEPQEHEMQCDDHSPTTLPLPDKHSPEPTYSKAYQCLVQVQPKPKYAEPETKQKRKSPTLPRNTVITNNSPPVVEKKCKSSSSSSLLSPLTTRPFNELSSSTSSGSLNERVEWEGERGCRHTSPLSSPNKNDRDMELLDTRVEVLEREVYALRAEIAKLKTQATSGNGASLRDDKTNKVKKKNIEYLKVLSISEVGDLLEHMNLGQYKEIFMREQISGDILTECTRDVLGGELGISKKIHLLRLLQIINGDISVKDVMNSTTNM